MASERYQPTSYYNESDVAAAVAESRHRELVGGLWDAIGDLQFEFLRDRGLRRTSRLIDIGCGCLRGGVRFVEFLNAGLYFGLDISQSLLDSGYDVELAGRNLHSKLPRSNLVCNDLFDFSLFSTQFDFALAQSVFTHLPANHVQLCLARLTGSMADGGAFYATFFLVPDDHPYGAPYDHPHGVKTFDHSDPFHYRAAQIRCLCEAVGWTVEIVGQWNHPRDQQMALLRPNGANTTVGPDVGEGARHLTVTDAIGLPPGADHYRAYVGPPDRYDFMSSSQFALLFALGLRDHHRVLDVGCGSLRLGRLLIPFLQERRYYGIDPNRWLIDDAIARELGNDAVRIKQPFFSYHDDFRCDVFGERFDYIVAQSILTHCGNDLALSLLQYMSDALADRGLIVFSIIESDVLDNIPPEVGWVYPQCVQFGQSTMSTLCRHAGLSCMRLPWFHPGATWYVAARHSELLPQAAELQLLRGAVLFDPQFARSRVCD